MILMGSHFVSSTLIYILVNMVCPQWFSRKFQNNKFYNFTVFESKKKPFFIGNLIRWVSLPYPVKNTLVALAKVSYPIYIITLLPRILFQSFFIIWIGLRLGNFKEMFRSKKWKDQSTSEKLNSIFTYATMATNIFILCFIGFYARKKLKNFNREQKQLKLKKEQQKKKQLNLSKLNTPNPNIGQELGSERTRPETSLRLNNNEIESQLQQIQEIDDESQNQSKPTKYPSLNKHLEQNPARKETKTQLNGSLLSKANTNGKKEKLGTLKSKVSKAKPSTSLLRKSLEEQGRQGDYLETEERGILDTERETEEQNPEIGNKIKRKLIQTKKEGVTYPSPPNIIEHKNAIKKFDNFELKGSILSQKHGQPQIHLDKNQNDLNKMVKIVPSKSHTSTKATKEHSGTQESVDTPSKIHLEGNIQNSHETYLIEDEESITPVKPTLPNKGLKYLTTTNIKKRVE